jgi:hypothetical protein
MLQPPEPASRPLSIRTNATSATQQDITGETWKMAVTKENCWDDLILTLGMSSVGKGSRWRRDGARRSVTAAGVCRGDSCIGSGGCMFRDRNIKTGILAVDARRLRDLRYLVGLGPKR